jgi:hypothetical protein
MTAGRRRGEDELTEAFWRTVGGTLVPEYPAIERGHDQAPRWIDGVILLDEEFRLAPARQALPVHGKRIVTVQAKLGRLGMYLMGQALFSRHLLERLGAEVVRAVAVCEASDRVLSPLLALYKVDEWIYRR